MRLLCLIIFLVSPLTYSIVQADTLSIALPSLTGPLLSFDSGGHTTYRKCSFDLGTTFDSIISVQVKWSGTITDGIGHGDGVEAPNNGPFPWPAEIVAYLPADSLQWHAVVYSGHFDTTTLFERSSLKYKWNFLLGGKGVISVDFSPEIIIGGVMVQPPSGVLDSIELIIIGIPSVTKIRGTATSFARIANATLYQNYPNPFPNSTKIMFNINDPSFVTLRVYNASGQIVATLFNGQCSKGTREVAWDASNLPGGVYLYRMETGHSVQEKKMVLTR